MQNLHPLLTYEDSLQGWDVALAILQSYRDAIPQASPPETANGRMSGAMGHEESLRHSASSLTVHLVVVDVIATSYKGNDVCIPPTLATACLCQDIRLSICSAYAPFMSTIHLAVHASCQEPDDLMI